MANPIKKRQKQGGDPKREFKHVRMNASHIVTILKGLNGSAPWKTICIRAGGYRGDTVAQALRTAIAYGLVEKKEGKQGPYYTIKK